MKSLFAIPLITVALLAAPSSAKTCRALAMSGGANKGAYEAGVIYGLNHLLDPKEVAWDVVSGVSAGALNGAAISVWAPEDGLKMSEWLVDMWMNMTSSKVYKEWPGGYTEGLFSRSGVFDNSPLFNFVDYVVKEFGGVRRAITVSSVDVQTGEYVTFSEKGIPIEKLTEKVVASAAIPFVFPHSVVDGRILMDGGTVWNTNMVSAVERCMEMVDKHEEITMDIIICGNKHLNTTTNTGNTIDNYMRYWSIKNYNKALSDVQDFKKAYPNINYRYFFISSGPLTWGLDEMKFEPEVLGPMIETGKKDAKTMVERGPGQGFKLLDEWHGSEQLRNEHPLLADYIHKL